MANVTDIEIIVKKWAWNVFLKTRTKEDKKLKYEDAQLIVKWDRVKFITQKPEFSENTMVDLPKAQVVFRSTFENTTGTPQEHSFQTERTTSCVSTTEVTKGFTKGFNLELKLGLPDEVAGVTAGFGREVNMESTDQNSTEESLTWSVNSVLSVQPNTRTTAEMVVREKEYSAKYEMSVDIRGLVIVSVLNVKENNSFVQTIEGDFSKIMKEAGEKPEGVRYDGRTVTWTVQGSCKFRFGIEQQVRIQEFDIED